MLSTTSAVCRELECPVAFRNILVAIDFSACSIHAAQVAVTLARSSGARLVLLHIRESFVCADPLLRGASPLDMIALSCASAVPDELDSPPSLDGRLLALQQELAEGASVRVEARLGSGSAAAQIIDVAYEEGSDLIVMGGHGRTGLPRWLMGSVAETVVRHARCPVLTLRLPQAELHPSELELRRENVRGKGQQA